MIDINNFEKLMNDLLVISNVFSYVIRTRRTTVELATDSEKKIIQIFDKYLIDNLEVEAWPGTKLLGHKAHIFYYQFNLESSKLLTNISNSIFEWVHPNKPEDLCFYKDKIPVFGSIAHEKYCFTINDKGEYTYINENNEYSKDI
jgi:hypothetical protein